MTTDSLTEVARLREEIVSHVVDELWMLANERDRLVIHDVLQLAKVETHGTGSCDRASRALRMVWGELPWRIQSERPAESGSVAVMLVLAANLCAAELLEGDVSVAGVTREIAGMLRGRGVQSLRLNLVATLGHGTTLADVEELLEAGERIENDYSLSR